jgi:hypothetical protein
MLFKLIDYDVVTTDGTVSIQGPDVVWKVDVRTFAGKPSLLVVPGTVGWVNSLEIDLRGARWPGTDAAADFSLQIKKIGSGKVPLASATISYPFAHFQVTGELQYILGANVEVQVALSGRLCSLGASNTLSFSPGITASAAFCPGYFLKLEGNNVATISGFGGTLVCASLKLSAMTPAASSEFPEPPPLRSSLSLQSQGTWVFEPLQATGTPLGTLKKVADLYNSLTAELGEDTAGNRRQAVRFISSSEATQFSLQVGPGLSDLSGNPVVLPLARAQQLYIFDEPSPHLRLWASSISSPLWVKSAEIGLQLIARSSDQANVAFTFDGPQGTAAQCSLPFTNVTAPLEGAVVEPIEPISKSGLPPSLSLLPLGTNPTSNDRNWVTIGTLPSGQVRLFIQDFALRVTRPEDLLVLELRFDGMALQAGEGLPLALLRPQTGSLSVSLPAQHMAESTYYQGNPDFQQAGDPNTDILGSPPIPVRMAGETQLTFTLPGDSNHLPWSLDTLLDWAQYPLSPDPNKAFVELPWRLLLSPGQNAGWSHKSKPVRDRQGKWTELWHTRLGVRKPLVSGFFVDERDTEANQRDRVVRAIRSPDSSGTQPTDKDPSPFSPVQPTLRRLDRWDIVDRVAKRPDPISINRLMLSALGGWLDVRGSWSWEPGDRNTLAEWHHIVAQGRDQYVRVVNYGYLFPFGHRAAWVKIFERKFSGDANNTAYLIEQDYVVVTQQLRQYSSLWSAASRGRDLPLTEIEISTVSTPPLDRPSDHPIVSGDPPAAFWIYAGGSPFLFHMRGRDKDLSVDPRGRLLDFSASAIFVEGQADDSLLEQVREAYDAPQTAIAVDLKGQKLVLAPPSNPGDTTYEVDSLTFQTGDLRAGPNSSWNLSNGSALFYPSVKQAAIHLPAVRQLATSKNGSANQPVAIQYLDQYLKAKADFDQNPGEVFASFVSPVSLLFSGGKANGVASPDMSIVGLSRKFGTVGGKFKADPSDQHKPPTALDSLGQLASGNFNARDYFDETATLLGGITLGDVIKSVSDFSSKVPSLKTDTSDPKQIKTTLSWKPEVQNVPVAGILTLSFTADPANALSIVSEVVTPTVSGTSPTASIKGTLQNFQLDFLEIVSVNFDELTFTADTGKKPDVTVSLAPNPLQLAGQLNFLQALMDKLKDLLGSGPSLDIEGDLIKAGYSLPIPSIGIGAFSLENIRASVGLSIPLDNEPIAFDFGFCSKDHPFTLTISLLGGGGYFAMELDTKQGIRMIEFGVDAGAFVSLDLGVASGSAHIMIGVYFHYESKDSLITGYVSAGGELTVLQLISMHIEFYLGLTYDFDHHVIWGEADYTVEVTLAFIHKSVKLTMRREFQVGASQQADRAVKSATAVQEVAARASSVAAASAGAAHTSIKAGASPQAVSAMTGPTGVRKITAPASLQSPVSAVPADTSIKTMLSETDWQKYAAAFA